MTEGCGKIPTLFLKYGRLTQIFENCSSYNVFISSSQNIKSYHHKNKISNWFINQRKKKSKNFKKKNVWNEKFFGPPIVQDRYFEVVLWIMSKYLITCFPHRTNWFKSIRPSLYETLSLPWWILMDGYCVVLFGLKYEI